MTHKKAFFLFLFIAFSIVAKSQTADEIVAKYIHFIGGAKHWKKIKTITDSGTYNYGGLKFPFESFSKAPNLYKYVVTFKGKSFTQAYDGKEGWRIDGFKKETQKTILRDKLATGLANEQDVELESPFIEYQKKGHQIFFEGKDTVDSKMCYKIKMIRKDADTATYFFDTTDFGLVKKQAISKNSELENSLLNIFYSDYAIIEGVNVPHKIVCQSNEQNILIITIDNVKINVPIDDNIFLP